MKSKIKENCLNSDDHRATDSFSSGNQIRKRKSKPKVFRNNLLWTVTR